MAGSEKRQRDAQIKIRCTADEFSAAAAKADKAGISLAAFARTAMLDSPGPRAQRRLPVDATLLRQVLGHLGKVGNNLNQIARHLNTNGDPHGIVPDLHNALADQARLRDMLYEALGKTPDAAPPAIASKFMPPRA